MAIQQQLGDYNHRKSYLPHQRKTLSQLWNPHLGSGAFQKSASWTMAGLVILTMKYAFTKKLFAEENSSVYTI